MALFSNKHDSISALPQGAEIAIPNDTVNEARALLLLEANGLVSFTSETTSPTVDDLDTAASKVTVTPVDAAQTVLALESVDGSVINNDFLKDAGLNPKDALAQDDPANESARPYVNLFVSTADNADNETYKKIVKALPHRRSTGRGTGRHPGHRSRSYHRGLRTALHPGHPRRAEAQRLKH